MKPASRLQSRYSRAPSRHPVPHHGKQPGRRQSQAQAQDGSSHAHMHWDARVHGDRCAPRDNLHACEVVGDHCFACQQVVRLCTTHGSRLRQPSSRRSRRGSPPAHARTRRNAQRRTCRSLALASSESASTRAMPPRPTLAARVGSQTGDRDSGFGPPIRGTSLGERKKGV